MSWIKNRLNYDVYMVKRIERYHRLFHTGSGLKRFLGKYLFNRTKRICSCNIFPTVELGRNIYIAHPVNITLGETSVLGDNIMIYPGVQLVSNFASKARVDGRRHPKIEDNCVLCVNSIVIGAITVGRNSIVAAGAIVTRDVPENTVVTGVNQYRPNRYENVDFLIELSQNTNRERIMRFDGQRLRGMTTSGAS